MSRTGTVLLRGGGLRLASLAVNLGLQMAMLPFILHRLGDHVYGIWAVVGAATGYYGLLDLGVSSAIVRFVARELGRKDLLAAARYVDASRRVFRFTALAIALLTVAVASVGARFIPEQGDRGLFSVTVLISGLGIACAFPSRVAAGLLAAELRHDVSAILSLVTTIVRAISVFAVLSFGGGLLGLAIVNASVSVLNAQATNAASRRWCTRLPTEETKVPGVRKELFRYAGYTFISQIADFARFRIHPLTISAFLRFSDVTPYAIHDRLQGVVVDSCSSVLSMLTSVFSRQEGKKDSAAVRRLFLFSYKISCYAGTFLMGMLVIVAAPFVEVWLGFGHELVVTLLYVRAVGSLCGIIQMPSVNLLFGSSENRFYAVTNSIHAIITLVSTVVLVQRWGLVGVVVGVAATTAIIKTLVQAAVACKVADIRLLHLHLHHTLPNVGRVLLFLTPVAIVAHLWLEPAWGRLILLGGVSASAFAGYIFFLGFNSIERDLILRSAGLSRSPNSAGAKPCDPRPTFTSPPGRDGAP